MLDHNMLLLLVVNRVKAAGCSFSSNNCLVPCLSANCILAYVFVVDNNLCISVLRSTNSS